MANPYAPRDEDPAANNIPPNNSYPPANNYPPMGNSYPPVNNYPPMGNGYPPAGMPPPQYPVASPYANVGIRFVALLLDFLANAVILVLVGAILLASDISNWINEIDRWNGYGVAPEFPMGKVYLVGILGVVIWFIYRVWMEINRGQTLGKMALKIKVVDVNGNTPTISASLARNSWYLVYFVAGLIPLLGFVVQIGVPVAMAITIGTHTYRQSFTDRWAKTYVVRVQ